jgi:hypothetical protein
MIDQPPESRFAGLLKPFFDSIGQGQTSLQLLTSVNFTPELEHGGLSREHPLCAKN